MLRAEAGLLAPTGLGGTEFCVELGCEGLAGTGVWGPEEGGLL